MRLIDADAFKEQMGTGTKIRRMMCDAIDNQPTAYDVEKVVEQLEEWSFEAEIVIPSSDGYEDTATKQIICTQNAIEIVRKSGVE